jgi:hypothetical protein
MNKSEELVYKLCRNSFLPMWSYANPKGKNDKELCDVLIVCEPDIIILSVKDIELTNSGDISVDWKRWQKKAIEESYAQIYGAEKWIKRATHVITKEGRRSLPFPQSDRRKIHRIAVALGGKRQVPIYFGEFGNGFVHVFDEYSLDIIIKTLDTITDFIEYLNEKEFLAISGIQTIFLGYEEDLLALYIHNNRVFPINLNSLLISEGLWSDVTKKPEFIAKREEDLISYVWDNMIESFCKDYYENNLEFKSSLTDIEKSMRTMAMENRFNRRILGRAFFEFLTQKSEIRSRCILSPSGVSYVFLTCSPDEDRKYRISELGARCFVIRGLYPENHTVVGIAIEIYEKGKGYSMDAIYYFQDNWTKKDQDDFNYLKNELGYFAEPIITTATSYEYPKKDQESN